MTHIKETRPAFLSGSIPVAAAVALSPSMQLHRGTTVLTVNVLVLPMQDGISLVVPEFAVLRVPCIYLCPSVSRDELVHMTARYFPL
jgi:hypothetical protein